MKNKKRIVIATLTLLILIPTFAFGASFWRGSTNVANVKNNLSLIQIKMDDLRNDSANAHNTIREIEILLEQEQQAREQRDRELVNKQTEIENKIKELQQKDERINQLIGEKQVTENELQQALRDVEEIERLTVEMLK